MSDINTTVDGVRAIEMRYRAIWSATEKLPAFYQSSIRLNSPDMGVLLPERFMPVIEADDRCISIFKLALLQTVKAAEKFNDRGLDFDWVSVFIPQRLLGKSDCVKTVRDFTAKIEAIPQGICFELPESVIADSGSSESIKQLRKAGYHIMLTGVDSERFPLFRLAELEPEYVMLNEGITRRLGKDYDTDSCISTLTSFISGLGAETIAAGVSTEKEANELSELGCSYFTGSENGIFSGKFVSDRFIRRKNQSSDNSSQ